MSELVAHKADVTIPVYGTIADAEVYLKEKADKVIAELKAQKAQAEDDCAYWKMNEANTANAMHETEEYAMQLYNELRYQKYKRCLAMADYCYTNVHCIMGHRLCSFADWKKEWFERWRKHWLELAEKFKEAE